MFGYVRPALAQLSQADRDAYQGAYCGLCHAMGRRHGFWSRFTLQYDFTFLAILLAEGSPCSQRMRCPLHPFQAPPLCLTGPGLEAAADESMILTWHKLADDIQDKSFWRGIPSRILSWFFRPAYRRAAVARPAFDRKVRACLDRLHTLEEQQSPSLDRTADTFASILSAAAEECPADQSYRRPLMLLLYHVGRWIYLADAWDDWEEDCKAQRYNPLEARFPGQVQAEKAYIETTMSHSVSLAQSAMDLMDLGPWAPVVENILCTGIPAVQSAVLQGRWKEVQRESLRPRRRSSRHALEAHTSSGQEDSSNGSSSSAAGSPSQESQTGQQTGAPAGTAGQ